MKKIGSWAMVILLYGAIGWGAMEDLKLGAGVFAIENVTLHKGMLTLEIVKGRGAPLMVGDTVVGFLFEGQGRFTAQVEEKFMLQVLEYNMGHGSSLKPAGGNTLSDEFTLLAAYGTEALRLIPTEPKPGEGMEKAFKKMNDAFWDQEVFQPAGWSLAGVFNKTDELGLQISGGKDDLLYSYDPVWDREEDLLALQTSTLLRYGHANPRWTYLLARQPLGRSLLQKAAPPLILTALEYECNFTDLKSMTAVFKESLTAADQVPAALRLELMNTELSFIGEGIYTKHLYVDKVTSALDAEVPFTDTGDCLTVRLHQPLRKGQSVSLTITCHGDVFRAHAGRRLHHRPDGAVLVSSSWRVRKPCAPL